MSSGSHPHLSHLYTGTPAGFLAPHSAQNLPLLKVPHEHVHPRASLGCGCPHSEQNLPVFPACPQAHVHPVKLG